LQARAAGPAPLAIQWFFKGIPLGGATNSPLEFPSVHLSDAAAYTVVVTNAYGAVTSAPLMLQVIAPVERRPVAALNLFANAGRPLNLDYASSLMPAPNWLLLDTVSLHSTPQYYFDLTQPLPPQRFYRAWQAADPLVLPVLDLRMVPAITLTGTVGSSVRLDYINRFGPIDAWVTLDTVTLTNTSQLYFDTSAPGQPERLYRLVPLP
jgi:hypothetical protein